MNSGTLLILFEKRLSLQRYAPNTIRSYRDYARIFLKAMENYRSLEQIPVVEIENFINIRVKEDRISVSYQKGLVGAIKKLYKLLPGKNVRLDYLYPKRRFDTLSKTSAISLIHRLIGQSEKFSDTFGKFQIQRIVIQS